MNRRELLSLLGGTAAAGTLAVPDIRAMAQAGGKGTLTYGHSTAVLTLDPGQGGFTAYPGGYEAAVCIYDRLLDFDKDMKIVPQLATSFEMAPDLMSATLKLRPAKFQDGTPVDAAAVKFTFERLIDKARTPTNRPLWDPVSAVETSDAATVVIKLKQPFSQLANSLAHGSGAILSPTHVQKVGENGVAKQPVGAGPFKLSSFSPGQELVLEAFNDYWGGAPATKKLIFKTILEPATRISALQTGAVDVIDSVPVALVSQLKANPQIEIMSTPGLRPIGFALNLSREPLKDPRVRQALNLAVPVKVIAERVFFNLARAPDSPLAFNTVGYKSVSPLTYDPARAKALLADAGYGPAKPLTLQMYVSQGSFPGDVSVGEIVANALQQVGVSAVITKVDSSSYFDAVRQDQANLKWDLAMFGFNPSNASGLYHMASLFKSNGDDKAKPDVWNICRYRNSEVDKLLVEADTSADEKKQQEALGKAQDIVWKDNPYIWLQVNENVSAMRKGVSGLEVWPIVFTVVRRATA